MWKPKWVFIFFVLLITVSCQQTEELTPTPFLPTPEDLSLAANGSSITPVPAVLTDIMANPEFYEGAHVLVTGQYFRRPVQACGFDPHPSPAGWDLLASEASLPAGGFNTQLRQLLPDGITMTVIGRFSHWEGPVGCGKQAVPTEMWFLDVIKIIDPAQLVRITLTPSLDSGGTVNDGQTSEQAITPQVTSVTPTSDNGLSLPTSPPVAPPTNTVQPTRVVPVETLGAGFTPVATDDINIETPTVTGTLAATATTVPSQGTATVTNTPDSGRGISTVTNTPPPGASPTPVTIPTSENSPITDKGTGFDDRDFEAQELKTFETHQWSVDLDANDEFVFAVVGEPTMNMRLTILDQEMTTLAEQDINAAGQAESITFESPESGIYQIQVSETNSQGGTYLLLTGETDYPPILQGLLTLGEDVNGTLDQEELHYWYFKATQNQIVDLSLNCVPDSIIGGILYDSDGNDIEDLYSDDELTDVVLPETGMYVLELENWDVGGSSCQYTLNVSGQ